LGGLPGTASSFVAWALRPCRFKSASTGRGPMRRKLEHRFWWRRGAHDDHVSVRVVVRRVRALAVEVDGEELPAAHDRVARGGPGGGGGVEQADAVGRAVVRVDAGRAEE